MSADAVPAGTPRAETSPSETEPAATTPVEATAGGGTPPATTPGGVAPGGSVPARGGTTPARPASAADASVPPVLSTMPGRIEGELRDDVSTEGERPRPVLRIMPAEATLTGSPDTGVDAAAPRSPSAGAGARVDGASVGGAPLAAPPAPSVPAAAGVLAETVTPLPTPAVSLETAPTPPRSAAPAPRPPAVGVVESAGATAVSTVAPAAAPPATTPPAPAEAATPRVVAAQIAPAIVHLAQRPAGVHELVLTVRPDALGPVTVRARIGAGGDVRVELSGATEAAREILRTMVSDLRRDLAAIAPHAHLAVGSGDGGASDRGASGGSGGASADAHPDRRDRAASYASPDSALRIPLIGAAASLDVPRADLGGGLDIFA